MEAADGGSRQREAGQPSITVRRRASGDACGGVAVETTHRLLADDGGGDDEEIQQDGGARPALAAVWRR
ncbi:hypothetical protein Syun_022675 [Stephania yunnanensis]|uniref:Uncharacterized protein n=1 Tax=Stephania yunnanensis TaxID=152371 RepID=A0AAP0I3B4_9MAGN